MPQACHISVVRVSQRVESQQCRSEAAEEARPARAAVQTISAVPRPERRAAASRWAWALESDASPGRPAFNRAGAKYTLVC